MVWLWRIYAVFYNLLMVYGLATLIVQGDSTFEIVRNFFSNALSALAILFYAFGLEGITPKAWRILFWYVAADVLFDLFESLHRAGFFATLIGYPLELFLLFPVFLALFRMGFVPPPKNKEDRLSK